MCEVNNQKLTIFDGANYTDKNSFVITDCCSKKRKKANTELWCDWDSLKEIRCKEMKGCQI